MADGGHGVEVDEAAGASGDGPVPAGYGRLGAVEPQQSQPRSVPQPGSWPGAAAPDRPVTAPGGAEARRRSRPVPPPVAAERRSRADARQAKTVRSRRLVRRIDVLTVFKVSVAFYGVALLVLIVAGIVVWNVADAFGLITSIQKSIRTLFSLKTFTIHAGSTLLYSLLIGAVLCVFGALLNALLATIYNLISDVIGGLEVVVVSEIVDTP